MLFAQMDRTGVRLRACPDRFQEGAIVRGCPSRVVVGRRRRPTGWPGLFRPYALSGVVLGDGLDLNRRRLQSQLASDRGVLAISYKIERIE